MATKTNTRRKAVPQTGGEPENVGPHGESLDQVRDILFGGQMRAVESRLERLEQRIMREVEGSRSEAAARSDALEAFVKKEFKAGTEKLHAERAKRAADLKTVAAELKQTARDIDKRLTQLDDETTNAGAELRDQLLETARAVSLQLKERSDELMSELQRAAHELRSEKADTTSLIALFSDMALRLTEELPSPQPD